MSSGSIEDVLEGRARWSVVLGSALAVLAQMPDDCVDAVITDCPYSSGGATRGDRTAAPSKKYVTTGTKLQRADFAGDARDQRSFERWCGWWMEECLRVTKPGGVVCSFIDWRQLASMIDAVQIGGWVYRGIVPWDKTEGARPQLGRFRQQAEFIVWGSKGPLAADRGVGVLPGVIRGLPDPDEKRHITGKTPEIMLQVVPICSPGGVILDTFFGGGSTGIAALRLGYRVIGVELTEHYHAIATDWLTAEDREQAPEDTRQLALFGG